MAAESVRLPGDGGGSFVPFENTPDFVPIILHKKDSSSAKKAAAAEADRKAGSRAAGNGVRKSLDAAADASEAAQALRKSKTASQKEKTENLMSRYRKRRSHIPGSCDDLAQKLRTVGLNINARVLRSIENKSYTGTNGALEEIVVRMETNEL